MSYGRLSLLASIVLFFTVTGCSDQDHVNIYSSRHYDTDLDLYENFTEETGIAVNLIEGSSDELIERINSEGVNSPADVVITVDAGRLWRAKEADVLQPISSGVLEERIPAELRDPENYWFGLSQRVRGIIYHKDRVDPSELEGYLELADDKWEGRLCIRSSNNIYNQSLVASMIESYGVEETESWAEQFVENFARSPQGGDTDQIKAVAAGQCDVTIANHYYLARLYNSRTDADREAAGAVDIYFPSEEHGGTHVNISGAGVAANSPNKENAIRFIEYLTQPLAQQYYAGGNYEFPVVEGIETPDILDEFGEFESDLVNVAAYGKNNPEAIRLMDRAGWR